MINKVYKLISPKQIVVDFEEMDIQKNAVIVKPIKLSICAADQRYYWGNRDNNILKKKLPMALIHEGVGEVIYDPLEEFEVGDKVVMIPNTPFEKDDIISENYLPTSKFRASGYDGFTQEYVFMDRDRIVKYNNVSDDIAAFIELISVAMHAIIRFEKKSNEYKDVIGIWGDGNLGFIIALILKHKFKNSKVIVIGKNENKLELFSFVDEVYKVDEIPNNFQINHAFEAVGGDSSNNAIDQIVNYITPEGTIMLLGVSENLVKINTRIILEKGITMIGNSRSSKNDFLSSVEFLEKNYDAQNQLEKIISNIININSIADLNKSFEIDLFSEFKTILNWMV